MYCSKCGCEISEDHNYCIRCGALNISKKPGDIQNTQMVPEVSLRINEDNTEAVNEPDCETNSNVEIELTDNDTKTQTVTMILTKIRKYKWTILAVLLAIFIIVSQNQKENEISGITDSDDMIIGRWYAAHILVDGKILNDRQALDSTYVIFQDDSTASISLFGKSIDSSWEYLGTAEGFRVYSLDDVHVGIDRRSNSDTYNYLALISDEDDIEIFFGKDD